MIRFVFGPLYIDGAALGSFVFEGDDTSQAQDLRLRDVLSRFSGNAFETIRHNFYLLKAYPVWTSRLQQMHQAFICRDVRTTHCREVQETIRPRSALGNCTP